MTSGNRHAEHPGLCDARTAVAFHAAPRPRWLTPGSLLRRRAAVVLLSFAAGALLGALAF